MPKVSPIQTNFSSGELSPYMYGAVDIERYRQGLATCKNFIPVIQGGLTRRPGTKFIGETKTAADKVRLIPFEFSTTQAYILEFGNNYIRFFTDGGQVESSPGVPYEVATTYTTAQLFEISFTQSADVLYLAHPSHKPKKLSRIAATNWDLEDIDFVDGPYLPTNSTVATLEYFLSGSTQQLRSGTSRTVSAIADNGSGAIRVTTSTAHGYTTGMKVVIQGTGAAEITDTWSWEITVVSTNQFDLVGSTFVEAAFTSLTAYPAVFEATDAGRMVRIKAGATWMSIKIASVGSARAASMEAIPDISTATATTSWRLGVWGATTGYPAAVCFHEDRLAFGGCTSFPQRVDFSCSGDYENFAPSDSAGTVTASNAVGVTFASSDVNVIRWMVSDEKGLAVGTVGGEFIVKSASSEALSATSITAKRTSSYGSAYLQPVHVGKATLFIQRAGRKLREFNYFYDADGFRAADLTQLSEHITQGGITQLTFQKEPQPIVWGVRGDGKFVGMTYERDLDTLRVGWHIHELGGTSDADDTHAVVESVAVIPSSDGTRDELWLSVKRYVNGAVKRTVETLTPLFEDTMDQEDAFFVDCGLTYDGAPATVISGLDHLEGETVQVLADGAVHPDCVVTGGSITLNDSASVVQVGYSYNSDAKALRIDAGSADGTSIGKTRRIHGVGFMLHRTLGLKVGSSFSNLTRITFRTSADNLSQAPALFSGIIYENVDFDYDTENTVCWRQDQPLPMMVLALFPQMVTNDRG
jgi:hypothetical protein